MSNFAEVWMRCR